MAKSAQSIGRGDVREWFSQLAFETQQSVLDEFSSEVAVSREKRIDQLEIELRALRGQTVSIGRANGKATAQDTPKTKAASSKKGIKVPPKYRDKATGNTWAGRGVQPVWIREYLKKRGNKIEDLLIAKSAAK